MNKIYKVAPIQTSQLISAVTYADSHGCRPQSVYLLARHGTRYAKLSEMDRISQRLHTIKNLIVQHAADGRPIHHMSSHRHASYHHTRIIVLVPVP